MNHDFFKSVSQGGGGTQDAENSRIEAIAYELHRRCELYEEQRGDSQPNVSSFEVEQRAAESFAKDFLVWDVVPRNVLVDSEGDIYVVDAEIRHI